MNDVADFFDSRVENFSNQNGKRHRENNQNIGFWKSEKNNQKDIDKQRENFDSEISFGSEHKKNPAYGI